MCKHKLLERDILIESFRLMFKNQIKVRRCKICSTDVILSEKGIKRKNTIDSIIFSLLIVFFGLFFGLNWLNVKSWSIPVYVTVLIAYIPILFIIRYLTFYIALHFVELEEIDGEETVDNK